MSSKVWTFTLNNYDQDFNYLEYFKNFRIIRLGIFERQKGNSGNQHLQGYLSFTYCVRLSQCKRILEEAHWEIAKGTPFENYKYCSREGDFQILGDWRKTLEIGEKSRKEKILTSNEILRGLLGSKAEEIKNSYCYIRNKNQYDDRIKEIKELIVRYKRFEKFSTVKLTRWQIYILQELFNQNDRKIMWCYETVGGRGKSFLAHLLFSCYDFDLFDGITSSRDIV